MKIASASSKSFSVTVPLPIPIVSVSALRSTRDTYWSSLVDYSYRIDGRKAGRGRLRCWCDLVKTASLGESSLFNWAAISAKASSQPIGSWVLPLPSNIVAQSVLACPASNLIGGKFSNAPFWKNSGDARVVASAATALAPFSQNSMAASSSGLPKRNSCNQSRLLINPQR